MPKPAFEADAFLDTVAPALGLVIEPDWRPAVRQQLVAAAEAAGLVLDFPLSDQVESAPVFEA